MTYQAILCLKFISEQVEYKFSFNDIALKAHLQMLAVFSFLSPLASHMQNHGTETYCSSEHWNLLL